MKYMRSTLGLLMSCVFVLLFISCEDNELELFGDEIQNSPVIYGMMQRSSSASQFIRVERSFGDPEVGALTLAKDENEVYFNDVDVILTNSTTGESTTLQRINAEDRGYERVPGDFLVSPNYIYELAPGQMQMREQDEIIISVNRSDDELATSTTTILPSTILRVPSLVMGRRNLSFDTVSNTLIRWAEVEGTDLFVVRYEMDILERNGATQTSDTINLTWDMTNLVTLPNTSSSRRVDIDGTSFFNFISGQFEPQEDVIRQFIDGRIVIEAYGPELQAYIDVINANLGITSSQEVPVYTNIEGGFGLFTSLSRNVFSDVRITTGTVLLMDEVPATQDLGFVP